MAEYVKGVGRVDDEEAAKVSSILIPCANCKDPASGTEIDVYIH